jgi:hydrogenase nickel incorporation protein HypA/HybF
VHELSLCGAIADIAKRRAGERGVAVIHVRIGQLRQIVPDTLVFCWSMVSCDTELDGSVLEIERVAAELRCRACATDFGFGNGITVVCPACGGLDAEVVAGEEFFVTALELAEV